VPGSRGWAPVEPFEEFSIDLSGCFEFLGSLGEFFLDLEQPVFELLNPGPD
jgi:hypothetical protein